MPRVTVKDMNQQVFVRALATFLKKAGKLEVPEWVDTVKLAYNENQFYKGAASTTQHLYHQGGTVVNSLTKTYKGCQK